VLPSTSLVAGGPFCTQQDNGVDAANVDPTPATSFCTQQDNGVDAANVDPTPATLLDE
jgi:hypothetical protein